MVDQWCNSVRDILLAHFGLLTNRWASFKWHSLPGYFCGSSLYLYGHRVHIFWSFKSFQSRFFEHNDSPVLRWPPLLPELNRSPLGCGEMENLHHGCAADKLAVILWSYPCTNLRGTFPALVEFIVEIINWALKAKGLQANTCRPSSSIQWLFKTTVS